MGVDLSRTDDQSQFVDDDGLRVSDHHEAVREAKDAVRGDQRDNTYQTRSLLCQASDACFWRAQGSSTSADFHPQHDDGL